MSAEKGRIFGNRPNVEGEVEIKAWISPTEAEVDAMPLLPKAESRTIAGLAQRAEETSQPKLPDGIEEDSTHAFIFRHPREAAAVLRTILRRDQAGSGELTGLSAPQVVATFLIAAGQEIGSLILEQMNWEEKGAVTQGIVQTDEVGHQTGMHALEMVRQRIAAGDFVELGGTEYARSLLTAVIGPHGANDLVEKTLYPAASNFELIKQMRPEQIGPFVSHEHPQTIALILSQLEAPQAGGILAQLPQRMQADVAYRIATMEDISPAAIERVKDSLSWSLMDMAAGMRDAGGPKMVADMLNMTGSSVEKNVLDQMDAQDPEVAESVRNLMFVFEDISKLTDREIQTLLREVDQKDLTISLKAASEEMKDKVLGNMSEETRTFITEQMEFLGPMRLSEVEEVQLRIVQQVRQLEEKGQITIVRGAGPDQFV